MSKHSKPKPFDPSKPVVVSHPSTGPRTPEGKAISARNATRHGCTSEILLLPSERLADLQALQTTYRDSYQPRDKAETHLLDQLITADWFLLRATRTCAQIESQLFSENPNPLTWDDSQHRALARFLRYQTARANTVAKHRRALEDYRRARSSESRASERLCIAQSRLKIYQEKNKPEPTFEESLALMRQQAIALGFQPKPLTLTP